MDKMDKNGMDLGKVNIERLKEIFPECVADGKVDFDALKVALGDDIDTSKEKYSFNWVGKANAMKIALTPSAGTLIPCKEKSKDWDKTENLYIEGDNLEVLKILEKTYHNKIKMIYIDPPYNTGKDFVYHDDFHDNIQNYLDNSSQSYRTNPETAGRFHTDWLNMMYPRLKIARELLTDDGVIFISIDDNEAHNMRRICDELFGEYNFVGTVIWERAFSPKNDAKYFSSSHDYVVVYAKNILNFVIGKLPRTAEMNARYKNPDNDPNGPWQSGDLTAKTYSADYDYPITTPSGKVIMPTSGRSWITSQENMQKWINEGRIWFGEHGDNTPRFKRYLSDMTAGIVPTTLWKFDDVGHSQEGRQEVKNLFDGKGFFDGPKPVRLMNRILQIANIDKDSVVLDLFSGSATTAHAVMQLNAEDGGKRKFILVQLPEECDEKSEAYKAGYNTICDIGEERIRRAGAKIYDELEEKRAKAGLFADNEKDPDSLDLGFKVFKLDSTNIKPWDATVKYDEQTIFELNDDVIKEGRRDLDVVYEIMLKYGVFNMPLKEERVNGKSVYSVGGGYMIISLNDEITTDDVLGIASLKPKAVVFKESGFVDDNAKINADYTLKRLGIDNVKCI